MSRINRLDKDEIFIQLHLFVQSSVCDSSTVFGQQMEEMDSWVTRDRPDRGDGKMWRRRNRLPWSSKLWEQKERIKHNFFAFSQDENTLILPLQNQSLRLLAGCSISGIICYLLKSSESDHKECPLLALFCLNKNRSTHCILSLIFLTLLIFVRDAGGYRQLL